MGNSRNCFRPLKIVTYGTVYTEHMPIAKENVQKHLGLFLDGKLNFLRHIYEKIKKINKVINVTKKTQLIIATFFIEALKAIER